MKTKYLQAKVSIQKENNKIVVVASDETLDRHGEVLPISQWDLSKFMGSPRMLVDHNHEVSSIVGKWNDTHVQGTQLQMTADFHDFTPLAKAVAQMVQEGYLDTVSVGFIPHGPTQDGGKESFELIECSWVTVPANPNARVMAAMKALEGKEISVEEKKLIEEYVGEKTEQEPEEIKNVISDIEGFKALPTETEVVAITYALLSQLIADSEHLKNLTTDEKAKVEAVKKGQMIARLALKEAATLISQSLRELNKKSE